MYLSKTIMHDPKSIYDDASHTLTRISQQDKAGDTRV